MVKVYFESGSHADLVAIFDNDETYNVCVEALEKLAEKNRMILTESVENDITIDSILIEK
jgi:hypothetical protein